MSLIDFHKDWLELLEKKKQKAINKEVSSQNIHEKNLKMKKL
jgi:hypothetical protein